MPSLMSEIYLDNAATTRVRPEVVAAITESMRVNYGNPSSPHAKGLAAETAVRRSREQVASALRVDREEIFFTSGGTESNNLAIKGVARLARRQGGTFICSEIEHPSVLEAMADLKGDGFRIKTLPVDASGRVRVDQLAQIVDESTRLLSLAAVNNEIGTVQNLSEIIAAVRRINPQVVVHVDAVQGLGKISLTPRAWGVDLLSVSGHKIHGPKGIGALYVRRGLRLHPLLSGGEQEGGLRSGTENVPGIVGLGMATELAVHELPVVAQRLREFRTLLLDQITSQIPQVKVLGPSVSDSAPHILSLAFPGVKGEVLVRILSDAGVYVSTGSACSSKKRASSHVIAALGVPKELREGSCRLSFSHETTEPQVREAADHIVRAYHELARWRR